MKKITVAFRNFANKPKTQRYTLTIRCTVVSKAFQKYFAFAECLNVATVKGMSPFIFQVTTAPSGHCFSMIFHTIADGPRTDEVTGEWRRLHNEELNDLYSSPNIVRVIKSRRLRWAGHVARMGEERGRIGSWWGNRRERDHWGDLGVDVWIILGWISRR